MKRLKHIARAALLALPALSWAHANLVQSEPAKDARLPASPPAIVLAFNEPIEPLFSAIKLLDAQGKPLAIDKAAVDPADKKRLRATLPVLASGKYTVRYNTVGRDGHKRSGHFDFYVK